jgi:hypothetical protein
LGPGGFQLTPPVENGMLISVAEVCAQDASYFSIMVNVFNDVVFSGVLFGISLGHKYTRSNDRK